jgi:hypothetical protein
MPPYKDVSLNHKKPNRQKIPPTVIGLKTMDTAKQTTCHIYLTEEIVQKDRQFAG